MTYMMLYKSAQIINKTIIVIISSEFIITVQTKKGLAPHYVQLISFRGVYHAESRAHSGLMQ